MFYLFGGSSNNNYLNDLWSYDPISNIWTSITYKGSAPSARDSYGMASEGDVMILWGGGTSDQYLNDVYLFNSLLNQWTQLFPINLNIPSPRKGACTALKFPYAYIAGGVNSLGIHEGDLWQFDLGSSTYNLLSSELIDPLGNSLVFSYAKCEIMADAFYLYSCSSSEIQAEMTIFLYNFSISLWSPYLNYFYTSPGSGGMVLPSLYFEYGGRNSLQNSQNYMTILGGNWSMDIYELDSAPFYYGDIYFGSKFFVHNGGLNWFDSTGTYIYISDVIASPEFAYIDFLDYFLINNLSHVCSVGTFFNGTACQPCGPGTFASNIGSLNCTKCGLGKFNSKQGATSPRQCYPCPLGTYSNVQGASICINCLSNNFCPIGSFSEKNSLQVMMPQSIQPKNFSQSAFPYTLTVQLSVIFGFFTISLILLCIPYTKAHFARVDVFAGAHYSEGKYQIYSKTSTGGVLSLILASLIIMLSVSTIFIYQYQNIEEIKVLQPYPVLENFVNDFTANIEVEATFFSYGDSCGDVSGCGDLITISKSDLIINSDAYTCAKVKDSCYIKYSCFECIVGSSASLLFALKETYSFSSGIFINVSSTSSIPESISSEFVPIYSDFSNVFIGNEPSVFSFSMIPSLFESNLNIFPRQATGYHVANTGNTVVGSQYSVNELARVCNLYATVILTRSVSGTFTQRIQTNSVYSLISILLGSIAGCFQIMIYFLIFSENLQRMFKKNNQIKIKLERLKNDRERLNLMMFMPTRS